jgi:predicted amidohydrolase
VGSADIRARCGALRQVRGRGRRLPFSNGTTEFCSQKERLELARGVVALGLLPRLIEEGWWEHMLFVVGPRTSLAEVEARLQSPDLHPRARTRLERAAAKLRDRTRGR